MKRPNILIIGIMCFLWCPAWAADTMVYGASLQDLKAGIIAALEDGQFTLEKNPGNAASLIVAHRVIKSVSGTRTMRGPYGVFFDNPFPKVALTLDLQVVFTVAKAADGKESNLTLKISTKDENHKEYQELPNETFAPLYKAFHNQVLHDIPYHPD